MIRNYIKIAFRNLWRHKGFSLINVIGLAIGLAAFMLIFMYVHFELSYDDFHPKADQIYRLNVDIKSSATAILRESQSTMPMGPALKTDFPQIADYTRIIPFGMVVKVKDQLFQEDECMYAEPSLFRMFDIKMVKGDPTTALKDPFSIVLTETAAKKYFGAADPIGQTMFAEGKQPVKVTGIIKDIPENSQLKCNLLYSVQSLANNPDVIQNWGNFSDYTFLQLPKNVNLSYLQAQFPAFLKRHISEKSRVNGEDYRLYLEPLKDTYMDPLSENAGNIHNIYIFSIIAAFVLLIAAVNFINLTTARAAERAKEVGIRKVIGAVRGQLTLQFLGESIIICLIAFLLSVLLVTALVPTFNQLCGKLVSTGIFQNGMVFALLSISLVIGLAAGFYPALALSGFKPISVLKGSFSTSPRGTMLRKGLVVFQFTTSIALIVGTIVVYNQLNYMRNQPLGFDKDHLVALDFGNDEAVIKSYPSLKEEFKAIPGVTDVAISHGWPGHGSANAHSELENKQGAMQPMNIDMYDVDYDFVPVYGMKVVAGRIFSPEFPSDTTKSIIINQAMVKSLGYRSDKDAIGKKFSQWGRTGQIIGVIKDFHYRSLQENIEPLNMRFNPYNARIFTLRISARDVPATIAAIEAKWKSLIPQRPFNYVFVDQNFNKQYISDERFGSLFMYFAVLAIFISCLGLLGLAAYSTAQRTREIGIRKVLGASVSGIINMLSKEFLQLVLIAALVAFPLSWYGMTGWLKGYAYHIGISWLVFATAGGLASIIAIITVSFQAIRAALANPVLSLRSE